MDGLSLTIGGSLGAAIVGAATKIWSVRQRQPRETTLGGQPIETRLPDLDRRLKSNDIEHANFQARLLALERASASTDARLQGIDGRLSRIEDKLDRIIERAVK